MRKINRQAEPEFWTGYKRLHPGESYEDLQNTAEGSELRQNLRKNLIQWNKCLADKWKRSVGWLCRKTE